MRRLAARSAALLIALAASAQPLAAQTRIVGRVVENNSGMPVVNARVEVFDLGWRRRAYLTTDSAGIFTVELRAPGGYRMRANRLGYLPNATPVVWTNQHSFMQVEVRLDRHVVLLAPIEIVAATRRLPSPVLESFRARARSGFGTFITRAEIERRRPSTVTDLLATVAGVRLESSGVGLRRAVYLSRAGARDCPAQIFVDGFHLNRGNPFTGADFEFMLDDAVTPSAIEGIEIYRGLATVPAEFLNSDADCGVVAIWTRRGNA